MQNEQIRVLLVDDDQGDFEMVRVMLAQAEHQSFKLDWVSTFEEAMDAFEADEHDVYFLDYFLEDRTGLDLLKEARGRGITSPIIMLTGRGSRTVDMEAMELGASDYLVKGLIDPDSLERTIRHAIERKEGAEALHALKENEERVGGAVAGFSEELTAGDPSASSARFRAVFESSRSGIAVMGLDGTLRGVNSAFAEFFPPTHRWAEGPSYLDLLDESDKVAVAKELGTLARGERNKFEAARRFLVEEGQVVWAHSTMVLIRNAGRHPDHLLVLLERAGEKD